MARPARAVPLAAASCFFAQGAVLSESSSLTSLEQATALYEQELFQAARIGFERAREFAKKEGSLHLEAQARLGLGRCFGRLGDYAAARTELEGALQLFGGLADRPRIAQTLNRLGSVAYLSGQGKQARDYYCRALIELDILGAIQEKAEVLYNLSFVPANSEEKARLLDEALLLAREAGDGLLEGRLLHVAGDTYVN